MTEVHMISRQTVANKIAAYLHGEISLAQLVDWAESAIRDDQFNERDIDVLRSVVGRLGVADVRVFGLEWNDCEQMLKQLGYSARVDIVAA
jgi:hypothetical protein